MKLLFADKNLQTAKRLMDSIDPEQLGISAVQAAETASQVLQSIGTQEVDILVLSAELADGSELLRRIREINIRTVVILYARKVNVESIRRVMRFHIFDFLSFPISPEALNETLQAAVTEAGLQQRIQRFYRSITSVRQVNRRIFWDRLLSGDDSVLNEQSYSTVGSDREYNENARFRLCLLSLADGTEMPPSWKSYALFNVFGEVITECGFSQEITIPLQDHDWCCVLRCGDEENAAALESMLERINAFVHKELGAWLNCYYSGEVTLPTAYAEYKKLMICFEDDVTSRGAVYSTETYPLREIPYVKPPLREWSLLLTFRQTEDILVQIYAHLDHLVAGGNLNAAYLQTLRIDIIQILQTALTEKQISWYDFFKSSRYDLLNRNVQRSVDHTIRFLEYIIRNAIEYLKRLDETQSAVGRVKEYIDTHFNEDITRSDMAQIVFLNPDYLARIFKAETGQSLGAYVKERRIFEAKRLLAETNIQVKEIALRVGYDNSSYFSHVFHQYTGVTPYAYRRQKAKK